jgi:hypothetical protein
MIVTPDFSFGHELEHTFYRAGTTEMTVTPK